MSADSASRGLQLKRKLALLFPSELRDVPLHELGAGKALRWPVKQRILMLITERSALFREAHEALQDLLERRNAELAEQRARSLSLDRSAKIERESAFRTVFLRQVISALERARWPPALVPFADPLHDLLHDENVWMDAVDFMLSVIDPALAVPHTQRTQHTQNSQDTETPSSPTHTQRSPTPSQTLAQSQSVPHTPRSHNPVSSSVRSSPSSSSLTQRHSESRGAVRKINVSLTSHNTPSLAAEREVPPIPLPHNARTQLSDECDLSSIRGSQSAFSLTQLTQRSEGVGAGAGAGVCRKCQGKSSVTARTVEILMEQNKGLTRELKRVNEIMRKREQSDKYLREIAHTLQHLLSESIEDTQTHASTKLAQCLQTLHTVIDRRESNTGQNNAASQHTRTPPRTTQSQSQPRSQSRTHTRATESASQPTQSLISSASILTGKLMGESRVLASHTRASHTPLAHNRDVWSDSSFAVDTSSVGQTHTAEEMQAVYLELQRLTELAASVCACDDSLSHTSQTLSQTPHTPHAQTNVVSSDKDELSQISVTQRVRAEKMHSLRCVAFSLAMRTSRLTGQHTLDSAGMRESAVWKLVTMISSLDRKLVPKLILTDLQQLSERTLSEFNALSHNVRLYFAQEARWRTGAQILRGTFSAIQRRLDTYWRTFRDEIDPLLCGLRAIAQTYKAVSTASVKVESRRNKEVPVVQLLCEGAVGAECAECVSALKEHATACEALPAALESRLKRASEVLQTEMVKAVAALAAV